MAQQLAPDGTPAINPRHRDAYMAGLRKAFDDAIKVCESQTATDEEYTAASVATDALDRLRRAIERGDERPWEEYT